MEAVKNSYNSYTVDSLSIEMGAASIKDDEYFKSTCKKVIKTRERVTLELEKLGFDVLDSQTNFIFVTHNKHNMKSLNVAKYKIEIKAAGKMEQIYKELFAEG